MCGIVCIYNPRNNISKNTLLKVTKRLKHRGPCAFGVKIELKGKLGIGHTRLKLVDLSEKANQPINIGSYTISFNGEIYNHKELRDELKQYKFIFKTFSDTEVIIKAIQKWGISQALNKFNGCFAFILYDKKNKKLFIVRDSLGEKQIVYCKASNGDWVFASEVKAIIKHPFVSKEPNINRFLSDLIFKFFSDKKETYFKNIFFVPAGYYLYFDLNKENKEPRFIKYWDINNFLIEPKNIENNIENIVNFLDKLLLDSINLRMDADCEIGSVLSGGIDSSIITKIAYNYHIKKYKTPFKCFTIKYINGTNRDLKNARLLCDTLKNINLYEILIDKNVETDDFDKITFALEEPLLDKVYLAQFLNYKGAKEAGIKAVINGQGADELWLGYYFFYKLFSLSGDKINYDSLIKYWINQFKFFKLNNSNRLNRRIKDIITHNLDRNFLPYQADDKLTSLINFSIKTHLQSMFIQEDRLSMSNSVEVRLPHVDLRIVKLALALPSKIKIFDGREKYILRKLGERFLPKEIYTRKKLAFSDPPYQYDKSMEALFNKKELLKSQIIPAIFESNIFKDNFNKFYELPIKDRWVLIAISRMEKVFFN